MPCHPEHITRAALHPHPPTPCRRGLLCIFRRIFKGKIEGYKPRSAHVDKSSYYLVCHDFDPRMAQELEVADGGSGGVGGGRGSVDVHWLAWQGWTGRGGAGRQPETV